MSFIFNPANYYFNIYALPYFIVGGLVLLEGILILSQTRQSVLPVAYFLTAFILAVWLTGVGFLRSCVNEETSILWSRYYAWFGICFVNPTIYMFSACWLDPSLRGQKRFVSVNYLIALVFYVLCVTTTHIVKGLWNDGYGFYPNAGKFEWVFILWFYVLMTLAFINFAKTYRMEKEPVQRKNKRLMFIAFIIAFTGSVEYLPNYEISIFPIAYVPLFVFVSLMGYCVVRYRLMEVETVIHKTLMWMATAFVAILPFAILINMTQEWFKKLPPLEMTVLGMAVMIAFYTYFRIIQPRLDHLFRRRHADLQAAQQRFSQDLVHLKNLRDLLQRFARMLRATIYVRRISVYLYDEDENRLVPAIVKGGYGLKPVSLDHPFLQWIKTGDTIVLSYLIHGDPAVADFKDQIASYFREVRAIIAVPFVIGGKLIGMLHLGRKENLRRYTAEEINFLQKIKSPVTIAFSNSTQFENISRLYNQVQLQNDRLKELDRLKSQFLANTSHELRTPLNGIIGLVESILDGADGDVNTEQQKHLRMIVESGANLKELINNLLELSRIESGQTRLDIKAFNLNNVIDSVLVLLEGVARKKGIQLKRQIPRNLPDVYGDPEKIQRVLINLVGNAIKFTDTGDVTVELDDEDDQVRVCIRDTGVGISEKDQKVIFDRFRQADGSETRQFEGTGLGLSIAAEIVGLHQSEIQVQSEMGKGSTFSFYLPKQPFEQKQHDEPDAVSLRDPSTLSLSTEEDAKQEGTVSLRGGDTNATEPMPARSISEDNEMQEALKGDQELILVIDDNAVNREVVKTRLKMYEYRTVEAVDGLDGLEKVEEHKPDLIILDLMMPRMSGYEFCKKVREIHPAEEIPIIMLTARTDMGDKVYGLGIGANDYISKPFHQEELMARIAVLLKVKHMAQELKKWNAELEDRVALRTKELETTQKQLIHAEKLATVGTMAGGIAHEINNPLTAVLTNAQILKMTANPEDAETIDLIEQGAKRCQEIIKKLMKYARKGPLEAAMGDVNLKRAIDNVVGMFSYQLKQQNIEISVDMPDKIFVKGIISELEQVFTNLILNARDAIVSCSQPSGVIEVKGAINASYINVDVIDNGPGIPKENFNKIFDPFFTTKEVGKGTGLGLAVTYGILEKHQCKIKVKSDVGHGTVFSLNFPLIETALIDS